MWDPLCPSSHMPAAADTCLRQVFRAFKPQAQCPPGSALTQLGSGAGGRWVSLSIGGVHAPDLCSCAPCAPAAAFGMAVLSKRGVSCVNSNKNLACTASTSIANLPGKTDAGLLTLQGSGRGGARSGSGAEPRPQRSERSRGGHVHSVCGGGIQQLWLRTGGAATHQLLSAHI